MSPRACRIVLAAGLLAWLASALILWLARVPLGHDESQYALATRDLFAGAELRWNYLSQGMTAVAAPGILAGGSELALRLTPVLIGFAFLLAAAQLARAVTSSTTAAWLVAIMAATICMVKRSAELLSDLPAATGLVAATTIILIEVTREDGPRWRLVLAAPWLAAALYLRYGSCVPIAIIGLTALVGGWRSIARRPGPAITAALVFLVLLIPHGLIARAKTGSPLGLLLESSSVPRATSRTDGLVTYVTSNPFVYYGMVTTPILLAGLASIVRLRDRRLGMMWIMAVASVISLGLVAIAQARYIFFSQVLLLILGTELIRGWICARPPQVQRRLVWGASAAIALSAALAVWSVTKLVTFARHRTESTMAAAAVMHDDAAGRPCKVVCRHTTQLEWYGRCEAVPDTTPDELRQLRVYVVADTFGEGQPDLARMPGRHVTLLERPRIVSVTRLDPE